MAKPNILIITTHDTGRHFGCYGVPTVQTPAIDNLAADGVQFNKMFSPCPICSPSRGTLLTGRYPLSNGLVGLQGGAWQWELHDYTRHLSHRLRDSGYYTAMFGLQDETAHIEELGFDDISAHGIKCDDGTERSAVDVAADVEHFLHRHEGDQPFYAQVGFFETHTPYPFGGCEPDEEKGAWIPPYAQAHPWPEWSKILNSRFDGDPARAREHVAELQGAVQQTDRGVGRIMQALKDTGFEDHTVVLFNVDHGPELPGAKWTMYDAGLGVAFIMRWPAGGLCGGIQSDRLLCNVDFLPTLYELIGLQNPGDLQGISFAAACRGDEHVARERATRNVVFGNWVDGLNFVARSERYKLIRNLVPVDSTGRVCPAYELYDLRYDPLELTDVAREPAYSGVLAEMQRALQEWLEEMDDPTLQGPLEAQEHEAMIKEYRRRYEQSRGVRK